MADPFANLRPIDPAGLPKFADWTADLPSFDDWSEGLATPFDGEPTFDAEKNPEVDTKLRLAGDLSRMRTPSRRLFVDYRANPDAYRHLKRLPREGQTLHMVISGRYALFDLVAAMLERHPREWIANLHLVTLGFSKKNGEDLCAMLDDRHVRKVALVCSYYFQKTSSGIYDVVVPALLERGQRVAAVRNHAKMLLIRMSGGAYYTVESSANLRSCHNVETAVFTRCRKLYTFHRRWLEHEILNPTHRGGTHAHQ